MGSWFSSIFKLADLISGKQLSNTVDASVHQDPLLLLSAAAEIAALHRSMEARSSQASSPLPDSPEFERRHELDTDVDDAVFSTLRNVKEDDSEGLSEDTHSESCTEMTTQQQMELFAKEQKLAFRGRIIVGNEETLKMLRDDILCRCGGQPSTSIGLLTTERELSRWRGRRSDALPAGIKTSVINSFLPNCRRIVDRLRTKSFCCQFVKGGSELVVASQDECIRFFQQQGRRDKYTKIKTMQVPVTSWSILDMVMNRCGDGLAYGTWKDAIFFAKLSDPSIDNPDGVTWNELVIPNIDASMAVFSLRFSRSGHEILCGGSDRGLHVFDLETMTKVVSIPYAHDDDVNAVCYGDTDSYLLYSGGDDGLVKVYDRRAWSELDHHPIGVFAGHRDGITYIDARGDDRYIISNSKDQTIKLWDLRKFSCEDAAKCTMRCVVDQQWDYRWQPAPPMSYSPLKGDTSVVTLRGHSVLHTLVRAKFSPGRTGKQYVYTGCARGEVVVYNLLSGCVERRLPGHVGVVRDVSWNPENNEIATCAWDGVTAIWRWDERRSHITSLNSSKMGADDSCDESYNPIERRKTPVVRRSKRRRRTMYEDEDSS